MTERERLQIYGKIASLNAMVAFALAAASRDNDDPRTALRDMLAAIRHSVTGAAGDVEDEVVRTAFSKVTEAMQDNIEAVAGLADTFLERMGAAAPDSNE